MLTERNLPIKFCQQCKKFLPWAAFGKNRILGDSYVLKSCLQCRDYIYELGKKNEAKKKNDNRVDESKSD